MAEMIVETFSESAQRERIAEEQDVQLLLIVLHRVKIALFHIACVPGKPRRYFATGCRAQP